MKILIGLIMSLFFFPPTVWATSPRFDKEYIIDVESLREEVAEALNPLRTKVRETQLQERFEEVFLVLEREEVSNQDLKTALQDLEKGIYHFRSEWDQIVNPLWEGQATIGEIISRVRSLLASSQEPGEEIDEEEVQLYEDRLQKIAREILEEPCPKRRERLTLMFRNVYNLRRFGQIEINLTPAKQVLLSRILDALAGLELQLTRVTFSAEEAFAVLGQQQRFLENYIGILTGLIKIDELTAWLVGDGEGIATVEGLMGDFQELEEAIVDLQQVMDIHAERLIINIEEKSARMAERLPGPVLENDLKMEQLIQKYAGKEK
ncbi:hypothetical protein LR013_04435 [candidate division NPL-UPA2 bacterium]|nr:hypothetical protein [candidate division NPL-UPA2 bacterium]